MIARVQTVVKTARSTKLTMHGAAGSMNPWLDYIGEPYVRVCIGICLHRYARDG